MSETKLKNRNKRKCKTCQYRAAPTSSNGCDYFFITKRLRGCPVNDCDKYIKGPKKPLSDLMREPIVESGSREFSLYRER